MVSGFRKRGRDECGAAKNREFVAGDPPQEGRAGPPDPPERQGSDKKSFHHEVKQEFALGVLLGGSPFDRGAKWRVH
jgi:hypothetical protein